MIKKSLRVVLKANPLNQKPRRKSRLLEHLILLGAVEEVLVLQKEQNANIAAKSKNQKRNFHFEISQNRLTLDHRFTLTSRTQSVDQTSQAEVEIEAEGLEVGVEDSPICVYA